MAPARTFQLSFVPAFVLAVVFVAAVFLALPSACTSSSSLLTKDGGPDASTDTGRGDDAAVDRGHDGPSDTGGDVANPPLAAAAAFEAHGTLKLTPLSGGGSSSVSGLPTTLDFVLFVDPVEGTLVLGSKGAASRASVTSTDGVVFTAQSPVSLPLAGAGLCSSSVSFPTFSFAAGRAGLTGHATGTATTYSGDIGYAFAAELTFAGSPDVHGPEVDQLAEVDPLAVPQLLLSEPLPNTATAQLVHDRETIDLLLQPGSANVVSWFAVPSELALRYATHYDLTITPWRDLGGNPGLALKSFDTKAAPAVFAQDGFEGTSLTIGGATVIDASVLPPIAGQRSAVLTSVYGGNAPAGIVSRRLTVRLPVKASNQVVRFALRPFGLYQSSASTYQASIRLAVPGGVVTKATLPSSETLATQVAVGSGAMNPVWMGEIRTVEMPLPAGVSSEVVFDFNTPATTFDCGLPAPTASYLIDDLRVE